MSRQGEWTVASWFKQAKPEDSTALDEPAGVPDHESTIEVKAQVIADAVRAGVGGAPEERQVEVTSTPELEPEPVSSIEQRLLDQALAERRSLVQLCLYALDRARSSGVAERIEEGLAGVGVTALRPDGARFDPTLHEAGGTAATVDTELDGMVAETEVVGFSDRGQVLRAPIVTVFTATGAPR